MIVIVAYLLPKVLYLYFLVQEVFLSVKTKKIVHILSFYITQSPGSSFTFPLAYQKNTMQPLSEIGYRVSSNQLTTTVPASTYEYFGVNTE